jgi:tetratricopeptide (TPR) repeat protein
MSKQGILLLWVYLFSQALHGQNLNLEKSKILFDNKSYSDAKLLLASFTISSSGFAEAQYLLGRIATEEKHFPQAVGYFEKAVGANSKSAEYHNWLGVLYGVVAMGANPFRQAWLAPKIKNEFEKAAALEPENIQTQWGLIHYYTKAPGFLGGSWQKAQACVKTIEKLNYAQGLCARGFLFEYQGDLLNAKQLYQNSLLVEPGMKEALDGLQRLNSK